MFNRASIFRRAWELVRTVYGAPGCVFAAHRGAALSAALRQAWAETKALAQVRAIPAKIRAERVVTLRNALDRVMYFDSNRRADQERRAIEAELSLLITAHKLAA